MAPNAVQLTAFGPSTFVLENSNLPFLIDAFLGDDLIFPTPKFSRFITQPELRGLHKSAPAASVS